MKITLVNPPQDQLANPRAYIPMGLAYIAAVLEKDGHRVSIADLSNDPRGAIPDADAYGITCVSATYDSALAVRQRIDNGVVIVGGIHPSIAPKETLMGFKCNYVIAGEGEYAFRDLMREKRSPGYLRESPREIIYADNIALLDDLPFPARHLFDNVVDYTGIHGCDPGVGATTIISSRGCPFDCAFCTRIPQTNRVRLRSADSMIREMNQVMEDYPVEHFRFVDDIFTINRARTIKFCDDIIGGYLVRNATWICITRSDSLDPILVNHMHNAGCVEIHIGVESGSQRVLNAMNKRTTVDDLEAGIKMIKKAGIRSKAYIMYGFEGETDADRRKTIEFVKRTKPDKVTVSRFTPLRGSKMWKSGECKGNWFYVDDDPEYMAFKNKILSVVEEGSRGR